MPNTRTTKTVYTQQDVRDHVNQLRQMEGKTVHVVSGALEIIQQNLDILANSTHDLIDATTVNIPTTVNVINNGTLTRLDITDPKYGGKADNGTTDNGVAFGKAYTDAQTLGGAEIFFPPGGANNYGFDTSMEISSDVPVRLLGVDSKLTRRANMAPGHGWVNITGQNVQISGLAFDGMVTTSVVLVRTTPGNSGDFSTGGTDDPMHANLTGNTTIWIHSGAKNIQIDYYNINHSGGYAILIDARTANVENTIIENGVIENCRPHLFKYPGPATGYGSWTGGVHYEGDGNLFGAKTLYFRNNKVRRITGTGFWGHSYATNAFHEGIFCQNNYFEDTGLDGIQYGVTRGGACTGNVVHRSGQITTTDSDTPLPAWQPATGFGGSLPAVAIDTTGIVLAVPYANNQIINPNGGAIDADGYGAGSISDNTAYISFPGQAQYSEDNVSQFGPGGSGENWCYGIQLSNSNNLDLASLDVSITGNVLSNFGGGAINLAAARSCTAMQNKISVAANRRFDGSGTAGPNANPIRFINIGTGTNQRSHANVVMQNVFVSSTGAVYAAVLEDEGNGIAFNSSDRNYVSANQLIPTSSGLFEFQRAAASTSTTAVTLSSGASGMAQKSAMLIQREGTGLGGDGATKFYALEGPAAAVQHASLQMFSRAGVDSPLFNISKNGTAGTGAITTGNRATVGFDDTVQTSRAYVDGFLALTDTTLSYPDPAADLLPVTGESGTPVLTMRYNSSANQLEIATAKTGGHRDYVVIGTGGGGGAGNPAAPNTSVQFNSGGTFGGSSNWLWNNTDQAMTVTGKTGTAAISVLTAFIQAAEGFFTPSASLTAIHAPNGTIDALLGNFHGTSGYNDLQVPGGGIRAKRITLERSGTPTSPPTDWPGIALTDGVAAVKDRLLCFTARGGTEKGAMYLTANAGFSQSAAWFQDDASMCSVLCGFSPNFTYPFALYMIQPGTTAPQDFLVAQANLDVSVVARLVVGTHTFGDTSGAVQYVQGFISATAGYFSAGTAGNCVSIPNGGVTSKTVTVTGGGNFNDLQCTNGGVFCSMSLTSNRSLQILTNAGTPVAPGSSSYGALAHKGGSQWWYHTGSSWQFLDFASISLTPSFTSVTIASTWTLSNLGTGQLWLNGDMSMGNLVIRGTANNSIQTSGAVLAANGYRVGVSGFGIQVIDGSGNFVINPANFSGGATFGGGIQTAGYNISGGYFGQTTSFPDNNNITRYFRGGVLVQGP